MDPPSRRTLLHAAWALALAYLLFSLAVATGALDDADLRLHNWVVLNVGRDFLFVPWSTWTAVGSAFLATAAVALGAFLAWRAGAKRTAAVILGFALAGGVLVDAFKGIHDRPYPGGGAYTVPIPANATACPEQSRCTVLVSGNATVYCPPGSRCDFYVVNATGQLPFNATPGPRTLDAFPTREGRAYPSGHTIGATVSWGLALLLGTRAVQRTRRFDAWAVGAWAAIALMGGVSRIPVHSHWWTDVVGSWLLGGALLALAIAIDDAWAARGGVPAASPATPP